MTDLTLEHFKHHEADDDRRFESLDKKISERPTKEEMRQMLDESFEKNMHKFFLTTGGNLKTWMSKVYGRMQLNGGGNWKDKMLAALPFLDKSLYFICTKI